MYGDAQISSDFGHAPTDVGRVAEPQVAAEGKSGSEDLRHQESAKAVAGADRRGLIKKGSGIEDLEHLRMRMADRLPPGPAEPTQDGR